MNQMRPALARNRHCGSVPRSTGGVGFASVLPCPGYVNHNKGSQLLYNCTGIVWLDVRASHATMLACSLELQTGSSSGTVQIFMSEVLTEFPAAVRISGTECAAGRAPKIAQKWAQGLDGAPHPGCSDSGTIRAGRTGRNPRRSRWDPLHDRESAFQKA